MKFSLALFATGALAAVFERQSNPGTQVILDALNSIISAENSLASQVAGFSGAGDVPGLTSGVNSLLSNVQSSASAIGNIATQLTIVDAAPLLTPGQTLATATTNAVNAAIAQHDAIAAACAGTTAYNIFTQLQTAANTFASNLRSKVVSDLDTVVDPIVSSVTGDISRLIAAFADQQTPPASCSGGSTPTSSSTASSGPTASSTATLSSYPTSTAATTTTGAYSIPTYTTTKTGPIVTYTGAAMPTAFADFGVIALAAVVALV